MKLPGLFTLCLAAAACAAARAEIPLQSAARAAANPLVWDSLEKKLELPGMTNSVLVTFWVTNNSPADAVIGSIESDCDCVVVEARKFFPWTIAPGAGGPVNVRVNTRGRFGDFVRMLIAHTSHGPQLLTVSMKIPLTPAPSNVSVREQDLLAAKADRQAVFRGSCAACHAAPTVGLSGELLFKKACAICHQAEFQSELVPDLAAIKHPTNAEHWRRWITMGKPGTVMPAFAISAGGILDANQIESLVEYLTKRFPSPDSAALHVETKPDSPSESK